MSEVETNSVSSHSSNAVLMTAELKWTKFTPLKGANRQKLPPYKKYVLVKLKNLDPCFPNPIVVGYLKYHAGVKSEPFFVTPGTSINCPNGDERVICWCDCLPENFVWPKDYSD